MMFKTLLFSYFLYMSIIFFLSLYLPFLLKIEIYSVNIIHFININMTLVVIFMILKKKSLFVSSVLKGTILFLVNRTLVSLVGYRPLDQDTNYPFY
jgi:hypothetical protein